SFNVAKAVGAATRIKPVFGVFIGIGTAVCSVRIINKAKGLAACRYNAVGIDWARCTGTNGKIAYVSNLSNHHIEDGPRIILGIQTLFLYLHGMRLHPVDAVNRTHDNRAEQHGDQKLRQGKSGVSPVMSSVQR